MRSAIFLLLLSITFNLTKQEQLTQQSRILLKTPNIHPFFHLQRSSKLLCSGCQSGSKYLFSKIEDNEEPIAEIIKFFASLVTGDSQMVHGLVDQFKPIVFKAIQDKLINQDFVCGLQLHLCETNLEWEDFDEYKTNVLKGKPEIKERVPTKRSTYTMLQQNDMHVDYDYKEGASIECGKEGNCCQEAKGMATKESDKAGYWGSTGIDTNCDIPTRTFEQAMEFIKDKVKPDYIIWLGDNSDHNIYNPDIERHNSFTKYMSDYVKKTFSDTPVFPILGNHEMLPIDNYNFYDPKSKTDIIDSMSVFFNGLLSEEAQKEFKEKGYYSALLDPKRKVRLVNTFVASDDPLNFYNFKMQFDPDQQLQWLKKTLDLAEVNQEDVFILRHIPVGAEINEASNKHLMVIFERYANIIRAVFAGHTHYDQLSYIKDSYNNFIAPQFIGPSLTTDSGGNPSFRVYTVDSDTNVILDYKQYRLNIDKYNKNPNRDIKLEWEIAYEFLNEYEMKNTSIKEFEKLDKNRQAMNQKFMKKYHLNYYGGIKRNLSKNKMMFYKCNVHTDIDNYAKCQGNNKVKKMPSWEKTTWYLNTQQKYWVNDKKIKGNK